MYSTRIATDFLVDHRVSVQRPDSISKVNPSLVVFSDQILGNMLPVQPRHQRQDLSGTWNIRPSLIKRYLPRSKYRISKSLLSARVLEVTAEILHEVLLVHGKFFDVLLNTDLVSIDKGRSLCDRQRNSS